MMSLRNWIVALTCGFLIAAPIVALGTLFDWPAITFLGAVFLGGSVAFVLLERMEHGPDWFRQRSV
jgi:hypothetical protein